MSEHVGNVEANLPADVGRLIHYTALNNSNWWSQAIDRIVLAVLWLAPAPSSSEEVCDAVCAALGSPSVALRADAALIRHVASGSVMEEAGPRFRVAEHVAAALAAERAAVERGDSQLRERLGALFRHHDLPVEDAEAWEDFEQLYLIPLLHQTGAHIYEIFRHQTDASWSVNGRSDLLQAIEAKYGASVRLPLAEFLDPENAEVRAFLLRSLMGQLAREAAGLTDEELSSMRPATGTTIRLDLFVDTNFLFSLLDLHDNPNNQSSGDLLPLIEFVQGTVTTRLLVLPETLEEGRRVLRDVIFRLRNTPIAGAVAAAAETFHASGLVRRYLSAAAKQGGPLTLTADAFFGPYEADLLTVANARGVNRYTPTRSDYGTRQDVVDAIVDQLEVQKKRPKGPKSYEANAHDMVLWHVVRDLRPASVDTPMDARSWVVTLDYGLLSFDRFRRTSPPICILPTDLIAMLQFWVPRSDSLDKALVGSLREPLRFLDFDRDAEQVTVNILGTLSRFSNAGDLTPDLIRNIVANQALRAGISSAVDASPQIAYSLVESAVIEESKLLADRLAALASERQALSDEGALLQSEIAVRAARERDLERRAAEADATAAALSEALVLSQQMVEEQKAELERTNARVETLADARVRDRREQDRRRAWARIAAFAVVSLGAGVGAYLLLDRPPWFRLICGAVLFALALSAGAHEALRRSEVYADSCFRRVVRKVRNWVFGTVAIGLVVGVVGNLMTDEIMNSPEEVPASSSVP